MTILDTNVVAELMRAEPAPAVVKWVASQSAGSLFTTTVTEAEILYGVALLRPGKRRDGLEKSARLIFQEAFQDRVLSFGREAARHYAQFAARRRQNGRTVSAFDAQIAAIATAHRASLATRNIVDFTGCEQSLINPWEYGSAGDQ